MLEPELDAGPSLTCGESSVPLGESAVPLKRRALDERFVEGVVVVKPRSPSADVVEDEQSLSPSSPRCWEAGDPKRPYISQHQQHRHPLRRHRTHSGVLQTCCPSPRNADRREGRVRAGSPFSDSHLDDPAGALAEIARLRQENRKLKDMLERRQKGHTPAATTPRFRVYSAESPLTLRSMEPTASWDDSYADDASIRAPSSGRRSLQWEACDEQLHARLSAILGSASDSDVFGDDLSESTTVGRWSPRPMRNSSPPSPRPSPRICSARESLSSTHSGTLTDRILFGAPMPEGPGEQVFETNSMCRKSAPGKQCEYVLLEEVHFPTTPLVTPRVRPSEACRSRTTSWTCPASGSRSLVPSRRSSGSNPMGLCCQPEEADFADVGVQQLVSEMPCSQELVHESRSRGQEVEQSPWEQARRNRGWQLSAASCDAVCRGRQWRPSFPELRPEVRDGTAVEECCLEDIPAEMRGSQCLCVPLPGVCRELPAFPDRPSRCREGPAGADSSRCSDAAVPGQAVGAPLPRRSVHDGCVCKYGGRSAATTIDELPFSGATGAHQVELGREAWARHTQAWSIARETEELESKAYGARPCRPDDLCGVQVVPSPVCFLANRVSL